MKVKKDSPYLSTDYVSLHLTTAGHQLLTRGHSQPPLRGEWPARHTATHSGCCLSTRGTGRAGVPESWGTVGFEAKKEGQGGPTGKVIRVWGERVWQKQQERRPCPRQGPAGASGARGTTSWLRHLREDPGVRACPQHDVLIGKVRPILKGTLRGDSWIFYSC